MRQRLNYLPVQLNAEEERTAHVFAEASTEASLASDAFSPPSNASVSEASSLEMKFQWNSNGVNFNPPTPTPPPLVASVVSAAGVGSVVPKEEPMVVPPTDAANYSVRLADYTAATSKGISSTSITFNWLTRLIKPQLRTFHHHLRCWLSTESLIERIRLETKSCRIL